MKTVSLISICAAGLAIGGFFGARPPAALVSAPGAKVRPVGTAGHAQADSPFAPPDAEARIVRMYSALQEPLLLKRRRELSAALDHLAAGDLPGLVQHAEDLPYLDREKLLPVLLDRWFEVDFGAAKEWMLAHPREFTAVKAWARANPEAAIQDALAIPNDWRASMLLGEAIRQLAGDDFAAQAARLRTLPAGQLRDDVFTGVLAAWAKTDPAAACAALAEITPGSTRDNARDSILKAWAEHDPAGALAQVDSILPTLKAGVLGNTLLNDLASQIGEKDPRVLFDWLGTLPVEFRSTTAVFAAAAWAEKEPIAALDWCMANGVEVARVRHMDFGAWQSSVFGSAFASQLGETVAWLEALPAGEERDRLMERGLADSLWHAADKEQLFAGENGIALRLFNELPEDAQLRNAAQLSRERANQGGLTDLNAWAQNFASGPVRAAAIAGTIAAAYGRDASQVEALLSSTQSASDRDAALRGLAGAMSYAAPADAAGRALEIGDAALRREALETIVPSWIERDPDASRAWLRDAPGIPADWKQAWMK